MATFGIFEWQTSALLIGDKYKKEKTYFQGSGSIAPRWCTNKGHAKMSKNKTVRVTAQLMTWIRANLASYSSICFSPFQRQVPTLMNKSCKTCTMRNKRRMVLLLFWKCLPGICYGKWPIDAYLLNILFCFWYVPDLPWKTAQNLTLMTWSPPHSASQPSQAPQFQPGPDPVMFKGDDNIWQQQEEQKQVSKEFETSM